MALNDDDEKVYITSPTKHTKQRLRPRDDFLASAEPLSPTNLTDPDFIDPIYGTKMAYLKFDTDPTYRAFSAFPPDDWAGGKYWPASRRPISPASPKHVDSPQRVRQRSRMSARYARHPRNRNARELFHTLVVDTHEKELLEMADDADVLAPDEEKRAAGPNFWREKAKDASAHFKQQWNKYDTPLQDIQKGFFFRDRGRGGDIQKEAIFLNTRRPKTKMKAFFVPVPGSLTRKQMCQVARMPSQLMSVNDYQTGQDLHKHVFDYAAEQEERERARRHFIRSVTHPELHSEIDQKESALRIKGINQLTFEDERVVNQVREDGVLLNLDPDQYFDAHASSPAVIQGKKFGDILAEDGAAWNDMYPDDLYTMTENFYAGKFGGLERMDTRNSGTYTHNFFFSLFHF